MKFTHFEIKGFKYIHTKSIKMDFNSPVQIFIGDNGSGKSSLFRELTPFPAAKPDYNKNGYKSVTIEHKNSKYEISSDFTKPKGAHSFIKDGEELNTSGTTGTQNELVETHLGLSPMVDKLLRLGYRLCSMTKNDRKTLFMSTNPNNILFIMDKHKKVCSQLRSFKNNLKLLNERKLSLKDKMVSKDILKGLEKDKIKLDNKNQELDKLIYLYDQKLTELKNIDINRSLVNKYSNMHSIDLALKSVCNDIAKAMRDIESPTFVNVNKLINNIDNTINEKNTLQESLTGILDNGRRLTKEVEEFEKQCNVDIEANIKTLEDRKTILEDGLSKTEVNKDIPVLDKDELTHIENVVLPDILPILNMLSESDTSTFLDKSTLNKVITKMQLYRSKIKDIEGILSNVDDQISICNKKYKRVQLMSYPEECTLNCELKSRADSMIAEVKNALDDHIKNKDKLTKDLNKLQTLFERLKRVSEGTHTNSTNLDSINEKITNKHWSFYVLNNLTVNKVLSKDVYQIYNKLTKLITNSHHSHYYTEAKQELNDIEVKLKVLKETNLPTRNLIVKTLNDKRRELENCTKEYKQTEIKINQFVKLISNSGILKTSSDKLYTLKDEINEYIETLTILKSIEFYEKCISVFKDHKSQLTSKIGEITVIIKEQNNLHMRLNEEIQPMIKDISEKEHTYSLVERALFGIPNDYTWVYMSTLIDMVNSIIKQVWSYDMYLLKPDKDKPIDYSLPLVIKGKESKDISNCSDGQKDIINLAWTIALMYINKYNKLYPMYMDEVGRALDPAHQQKLAELIASLMQEKKMNQMFLINHYASLYSGLVRSEVFCLAKDNVVLPKEYNKHVEMV